MQVWTSLDKFRQVWTNLCSIRLFFLLVEIFFVLDTGFLVLLVFGHQIVHVAFGFSEFHFVHTFASIPMQESFSSEHGSKLLANTLEQFLNGSGISNEGGSHFEASGRDPC